MRVSAKTGFVVFIITLASAALWAGDDKQFRVGPAAGYPHQTGEKVTVGGKLYDKPELVEEAFGKKTDLLKYGVLPILVVIENKRDKTVDLNSLEVSLVAANGQHVQPVKPDDLLTLGRGPKQPKMGMPRYPLPKKKNPLLSPDIGVRAFAAKLIPPGDSVSGFFYFDAKPDPGVKLYLNGLYETPSGKEIFYFEFPLDQ